MSRLGSPDPGLCVRGTIVWEALTEGAGGSFVGELVKESGRGGSMLEVAQCDREKRLGEPGPRGQYYRESRLRTWGSPKRRLSGLATGE